MSHFSITSLVKTNHELLFLLLSSNEKVTRIIQVTFFILFSTPFYRAIRLVLL